MKKITLLLILAMTSCGISYDGEERLVLQTTVVDRHGNPLENIETRVQVSDSDADEDISNGNSDANGNKLLIFPKPKSARISVYFTDFNNQFETKRIHQIELFDFVNYKLTLPNVVMYNSEDITTLEIDLQSSGTNNYISRLFIEAETPNFDENFHPENQENDGFIETYFRILKNQEVTLNYTIVDNTGEFQNYSVPIIIGNESVNYILNY